jgi:ribosomal-protein-alanine N-acetyltransferase
MIARALVREAAPADAGALVELGRAVSAEPEAWLISETSWRTVAEERRYLRAVRRYAYAAVLVAETPEGIVGRLSIARDTHPASEHVADLGLIVASGYRRRGIGRALLDAAVDWARAAGIRKLELHVFPHNEPAINLYEKLGYEREGLRRRQYARAEGGYADVLLMAKQL